MQNYKKVKGELIAEDVEVEIDLSKFIYNDYIYDELIKLEMYKNCSIEHKED